MSETTPCAEARETIQELLDGPVPAARRVRLDRHLAACAACRDARAGFEAVRASLRALPEVPLPDAALEGVWDRTIRGRAPSRGSLPWRAAVAVAASIVLTAALVLWSARLDPGPQPAPVAHAAYSPEEIERAEAELREVLRLTARAIDRSRDAAVERVLESEVLPALRRVPIRWPESAGEPSGRSKT